MGDGAVVGLKVLGFVGYLCVSLFCLCDGVHKTCFSNAVLPEDADDIVAVEGALACLEGEVAEFFGDGRPGDELFFVLHFGWCLAFEENFFLAEADVFFAQVPAQVGVDAGFAAAGVADDAVCVFFSVHDVDQVRHGVEDDEVVFDDHDSGVFICEGSDEGCYFEALFDIKVACWFVKEVHVGFA